MSVSEDKIELLSKLVIQLKTSQNENLKNTNEEINKWKTESQEKINELEIKHANQIDALSSEVNILKNQISTQEKNHNTILADLKNKFDKDILDLREDMLKLLKKYESKFQTQDDEIDVLKQKCEISNCNICNFESFKVHFNICSECQSIICSNCLQNCKSCKYTKCTNCFKRCNGCTEYLCDKCCISCNNCSKFSCVDCFEACLSCKENQCKKCLMDCRKCDLKYCTKCGAKCEKCGGCVSCITCLEKDQLNERCICGKLYCFNCEDECESCTVPCLWENDSRIFKGYHIKSKNVLPNKCLVKLNINTKGIETTHLGLTIDSVFRSDDMPTENFWSLVTNTGEKFSTVEYKKKGKDFIKYAVPCKEGDTVYIRYFNGDVRFLINRKEYPSAFFIDKAQKVFLYCLTHNDSTGIEIKSLKIYK